ncbi:MAG: DUF6328 family protein [Gaiellaceae bacterium]
MAAESKEERLNRELIELLNELRVALPGVQVLFAFLLTLPFTRGWPQLGHTERILYFVALGLAAVSSGFLIAPSAHHRLRFRHRDKEQLVVWGNRMALCGIVTLGLAIAASVAVIADFVFGEAIGLTFALGVSVFLAVLWFAVPQLYGADRPTD